MDNRQSFVASVLAAALLAACAAQSTSEQAEQSTAEFAAPVAAKHPYQVPSPNGGREDDYYWLRDDTRKSPDVLGYLNSENAYRDAMLKHTEPLQSKLYDELVARIKPDDASVPVLEHGYWYYTRFEPGKDYPIYARRKGEMTEPEQVLLDGNAMSQGHEFFQIGDDEVSPDGRLLAYTEDDIGRRQYTMKFKNLETGEVLKDAVLNVEPEFVWANDNKTVLYVEKDPVTLLSVRVHKHRLGTEGASDPLVYEEPDHSFYMGVAKSRSEKYLFIGVQSTLQSEWRYADANDPNLEFKIVLPREPEHEYQVENVGRDFIIRTNWQAPNFRIVRAPVAKSADKLSWKDIVSQRADAFVQDYEVSKNYLAINERSGGLLKMHVLSWYGGKDELIAADEPSYTMTLVNTPDIKSDRLRYVYTSLTTPRTTYEYDMHDGTRTALKTDEIGGGFQASNYVTEYLHTKARDGTAVPVSVAYRKGTKLDGTAPLFQYGYGSYGVSTDPTFRASWVSLLDRGFVVAVANIRGGEELGRSWYEDGKLLHKRNTFTDFIDVSEDLVKRGYGAKDKVFAEGRSAGGLLMGAVANMAPQDYRGIVAYVPFVDVVTTMLDESIPLTTNEFDEWGNPKEKTSYDYMLTYSPVDNVKPQNYPAMLVFTGLWDSQVQYYEPSKWVAKLRATKTDHNPLIFSIDMAAGHGGKSGRFQSYHDTAREYAFLFDQIGISQ